MCSDQWGTVWDTISYQVTGSFGDWMDSPIGLDAVGIDNEMALSHITPNNVFEPGVEQLHIDGNKGLVYSQIAALLPQKRTTFTPRGRVAYIFDPRRLRHRGGGTPSDAPRDLPAQESFEQMEVAGQGFGFEVKGPSEGVRNGGLTIEATFGNARGISPNAAASLILDYCGPGEHPGDPDNECREVARWFNQSPLYLQSGARIDLNDPRPGPYRIRQDSARVLPTRYRVSFSQGKAHPTPEQAAYSVSRMDFFKDLNRYVPKKRQRLTALRVDDILRSPRVLRGYDTVFVANQFMPGFKPDGSGRYSNAQFAAYAARLADFARRGGNLTLTDAALSALPALGTGVQADQIRRGGLLRRLGGLRRRQGADLQTPPPGEGRQQGGHRRGPGRGRWAELRQPASDVRAGADRLLRRSRRLRELRLRQRSLRLSELDRRPGALGGRGRDHGRQDPRAGESRAGQPEPLRDLCRGAAVRLGGDPDRRRVAARPERGELPPIRPVLVRPDLHGLPARREPHRVQEAGAVGRV
jgi:hypothetical protein